CNDLQSKAMSNFIEVPQEESKGRDGFDETSKRWRHDNHTVIEQITLVTEAYVPRSGMAVSASLKIVWAKTDCPSEL
ncbi:hypothetical protein, partial [Pseudomonas savastanoi]|uniref:hypothetical protein n=1 Tax=Pseudomonas savastanoi TaxID=29438 RepID=UPI0005761B38